jgi:hypothetical protein
MRFELSTLMQLAMGQRPNVIVGDLPTPLSRILGCHPAIVYLGRKECRPCRMSALPSYSATVSLVSFVMLVGVVPVTLLLREMLHR